MLLLLGAGAGVRPLPVLHFRQIIAMLANVLFVLDKLVAQELLKMGAGTLQCWTRSTTSPARWKRSSSFSTVMSNGVVVVPSSL